MFLFCIFLVIIKIYEINCFTLLFFKKPINFFIFEIVIGIYSYFVIYLIYSNIII